MLRKLFLLLIIVVVGAAMLAPVVMMLGLDRMPYDYDLVLDGRHYLIPVTYSLCASVVAGLLYLVVKR